MDWRGRIGRVNRKAACAAVSVVAYLALVPDPLGFALGWYDLWAPARVKPLVPPVLVVVSVFVLQWKPGLIAGPVFWARVDSVLRRGLPPALVAVTAAQVAAWLPQYLTWPWWSDTDHFAVLAMMWDAGTLPYRDLFDFNFPGPVYVMWLLGKAFGWGRTAPVYALDACWLIALGVALAAWSRARFGGAAGGLAAYLAFLTYYLSLDGSQVAQRDWYAALLAILALLALQAYPGGRSRVAASALFAAALTVRPYPILFAPALLSAVIESLRTQGRGPVGGVTRWAGSTIGFLVAGYAPLVVAGVFGDFLRGLAYLRVGGGYNQNSWGTFVRVLADGVLDPRYLTAIGGCLAVWAFGPAGLRQSARTWALALAGVAVYRPLSPVAHDYLSHPILLMTPVAMGFLTAVFLRSRLPTPGLKALTLVLGSFWLVTWVPRFCDFRRSGEAVLSLARGVPPARTPLCATATYPDPPVSVGCYSWADYQNLLTYLRSRTSRETRVANLLRQHPFPPVNGPAGRLTPFPVADAVVVRLWTDLPIEGPVAAALERPGDTVVVWVPDERRIPPRLAMPDVTEVVRRRFRPLATFGDIEVWGRRTDPNAVDRSG